MSDDQPWPGGPARWQPWHMAPLDREPPLHIEPDAAQAEALRKRAFQRKLELQALRDKARQQAQRQGHEAGFALGRDEGYAQGLEQGHVDGEAAMQAQIQLALAPLLALCQSFDQALKGLDGAILGQLVELAMATARQIAGDALVAKPEHVLERVRALLQHDPALTGKPRLWLHPEDLDTVRNALGEALAEAGWSLCADAGLARGGCRVASASGELDASLETTWASIQHSTEQALRGELLP
ncbi:MAG: flagellar assembly protein FliH [Pseudomonas sp.]|uniref:flagellar assembly protein FliH n=1 Tax=Pseudomonas abieticivorans TaxID=2931382 RepID=UPI0020BD5720|nr:flagellar assembly protein FliH [Pseudomonas sp. PIA16]MDE1168407.1 flagellar assembly protein FliH [Pseudomonas sp.]